MTQSTTCMPTKFAHATARGRRNKPAGSPERVSESQAASLARLHTYTRVSLQRLVLALRPCGLRACESSSVNDHASSRPVMLSEPQAGRGRAMTRCSRCWPGQRCSRCASFTARPPRRNMAGSGGGAASDTYCISRCTGYSPCGHHRGVLEGATAQGGSVHTHVHPLSWPVQHCARSASLTAKSPCWNEAGFGRQCSQRHILHHPVHRVQPLRLLILDHRWQPPSIKCSRQVVSQRSLLAAHMPCALTCWYESGSSAHKVLHPCCARRLCHGLKDYEACLPVTCRCWQQRSASGQHALDRHRVNTPEAPARVLRIRACNGWGQLNCAMKHTGPGRVWSRRHWAARLLDTLFATCTGNLVQKCCLMKQAVCLHAGLVCAGHLTESGDCLGPDHF